MPKNAHQLGMGPLPEGQLPLIGQVQEAYYWYRDLKVTRPNQKVAPSIVVKDLTKRICDQWHASSVCPMPDRVVKLHRFFKNDDKEGPKRKLEKSKKSGLALLKAHELFNIAADPCMRKGLDECCCDSPPQPTCIFLRRGLKCPCTSPHRSNDMVSAKFYP